MITLAQSVAERYDHALCYARDYALPDDHPSPKPTCHWPQDNIALLDRYQQWLLSSGGSPYVTELIHIPMAGHVLGLALKPHPTLDLNGDLEQAMAYIRAKQLSRDWITNCRRSLRKFRQFLQQERGLSEIPHLPPPSI